MTVTAGRLGMLAALAAPLLLPAGCDRSARPRLAPEPTALEEVALEVETVPLRLGAIAQRLSAPGSVEARRESRIGAEVTGRIVRVFVAEGDRVAAGAPLFEIDRAPYEMALRQTEAGLDLARANRAQLEADLARGRTLRRQNVLSEQEIERLTTSLAVARARERQAAEAVALARHQLDSTLVAAPFAASVAARNADEGTTALVQPQTIVLVLQETGELEARAAIPETQMSTVQVGDTAFIRIEGRAEAVRTYVAAVSDTIDPATRTYLVTMPVPNPDYAIKAGVFAEVGIEPRGGPDRVLAPREAIRIEDGQSRLLVVRDGRAALIPVETGAASEREAEIVAGAAAGELAIVGDAASSIAPGLRVRPAGPPRS